MNEWQWINESATIIVLSILGFVLIIISPISNSEKLKSILITGALAATLWELITVRRNKKGRNR